MAEPARTGRRRSPLNSLSISLLIVLTVVTGTMAFVTAGSVASYSLGRDISRSKEADWMRYEASREAEKIADQLTAFSHLMQDLARDSLVVGSIVDNSGNSRHIEPLLRVVSSTLDSQFGQPERQLINPSISILDYRGRGIATTAPSIVPEAVSATWVDDVMQGKPRSGYDRLTRAISVVMPIVYPGTARPEGFLLGRIHLSALKSAYHVRDDRWHVSVGSPGEVAAIDKEPGFLGVSASLGLGEEYSGLDLTLLLQASNTALGTDASEHLRAYLIVAAALMPLALAFGLLMGRLISTPIIRLGEASTGFDPGSGRSDSSPSFGSWWATREVINLAGVLDTTLQRVRDGYAEARLAKAALDATVGAVVITEAVEHRAIYVNRAFEQQTGYRAAEVIGKNLRFLHRFDHSQPELDVVRQSLRSGESCSVVLRNWRKDDTEYSNHLTIAPVRDDGGQLINFIGFQLDITERQKSEHAQRNTQKLEAIGQLTGGLAHDFNNMLGIIIGNLDMVLDRDELLPATRRRLERAQEAALRATETNRSLLAVARRQILDLEPVDLDSRIDEIMPLILHAVGKRIDISRSRCAEDATTLIDASAFDTALLNLVLNAHDAIGDQNGRLSISVRRQTVDPTMHGEYPIDLDFGKYLVLEVSDDGSGMTEHVRDRAFDPYFTTKQPGAGSGLGLSTVYGFARQSGGTAIIDTAPGRGTRVAVWLPLRAPSHPDHETPIDMLP